LRPTGMTAHAEINVEIDGNKRLTDVELMSVKIQMLIRSKFSSIERVVVVPHSISQQVHNGDPTDTGATADAKKSKN